MGPKKYLVTGSLAPPRLDSLTAPLRDLPSHPMESSCSSHTASVLAVIVSRGMAVFALKLLLTPISSTWQRRASSPGWKVLRPTPVRRLRWGSARSLLTISAGSSLLLLPIIGMSSREEEPTQARDTKFLHF